MESPDHVVGIVASAGGVEALCALLSAFRHDGSAFVVAMHLSPDHESRLPEVLAACTHLDVHRTRTREELAPNHIYVVPPAYDVVLCARSTLALVAPELPRARTTFDRFLRSLAEHRQRDAIGIVLSGANTDGTQGLAAIRHHGGTTYAQAPESAKFPRMPESAARYADHVAAPHTLGTHLMHQLTRS